MRPHLRGLLVLIAVLLAGAAIHPALAQRGSQPDPNQPNPAQPNPRASNEACAAIGQAFALIGDTGLAAEAMGTPATLASTGSNLGGARLVVYAPAAVGACADFQAIWGDTAGGNAAAELSLLDANGQLLGSDDANAARRRGPARHSETLRAMTKLSEPGSYSFLARLAVKATGSASNTAPTAPTAADRLEVKLQVEVRARPTTRPATGWIAGTVRDVNGAPIAGARIHATLATNAGVAPRRPGAVLPFDPANLEAVDPGALELALLEAGPSADAEASLAASPGLDQSPVSPSLTRGAVSNAEGQYRLPAAAGKYFVTAVAEGFEAQWYEGAAAAADAKPVAVTAGAGTDGIHFVLTAKPQASVSGTVRKADGSPAAGASVMAVRWPLDPAGSNTAGPRVLARAQAGRDGSYTLPLAPGSYAVGAASPATSAARPGPTVWWEGKAAVQDADALTLADNEAREGIDFTLP